MFTSRVMTYLICFTSSDDSRTLWQDTVNYVMCATGYTRKEQEQEQEQGRVNAHFVLFPSLSFSLFFASFRFDARIFQHRSPCSRCCAEGEKLRFCSVLFCVLPRRRRRRRFTVVRNCHSRVMVVTRIV